jgi:hypothetical protein
MNLIAFVLGLIVGGVLTLAVIEWVHLQDERIRRDLH